MQPRSGCTLDIDVYKMNARHSQAASRQTRRRDHGLGCTERVCDGLIRPPLIRSIAPPPLLPSLHHFLSIDGGQWFRVGLNWLWVVARPQLGKDLTGFLHSHLYRYLLLLHLCSFAAVVDSLKRQLQSNYVHIEVLKEIVNMELTVNLLKDTSCQSIEEVLFWVLSPSVGEGAM